MTYSVNSVGFSGVLPPGGFPPPGINPFTTAGFGGVPNIFPQSAPPLAFGVPGVPAGMNFAAEAPWMGAPLPIDPLTGLPVGGGLNFGLNPAPQGVPFGQPVPNGLMYGQPALGPQSMPPAAPPQPATGNSILDLFSGLLNSPLLQNLLGVSTQETTTEDEETETSGDETDKASVPISDPATALTTIISEASDIAAADGDASSISTADLAAVARNKDEDFSGDAMSAAGYMLGNTQLWSMIDEMDGKEDTKASIETLSKALSDPDILSVTSESASGDSADSMSEEDAITDNATALDLLSSKFEDIANMDEDGSSITRIDISRAIRESDDKEVKALATYLRDNTEFFNQVATEEGKITLADVDKALSNPNILQGAAGEESVAPEDLETSEILKTIQENKSEIDTAGGAADDDYIGETELKAVAENKDGKFDATLSASAEALLKDEELLKALNGDDKQFSFDELSAFVENAEENPDADPEEWTGIDSVDEAFDILNNETALNALKRNPDDQYIDFSYLDAIINGDDAQYDSKVKAAAQYLKDNLANDPNFAKIKAYAGLGDKIPTSLIADISSKGIDAVLKDVTFDEADKAGAHKKVLEVLTENNNALLDKVDTANKGGEKDQVYSDDDFRAALADNSGKYSAREKAALKWLVEWDGGQLLNHLNADDSKTGIKDVTGSLRDGKINGNRYEEIV